MSGVVLVTGGTGKTGSRITAELHKRGLAFRAASPTGTPPFDWSQPAAWDAALEGVSAIYLLASADIINPAPLMIAFLQAAIASGASRFVLHSAAPIPAGGPGFGQVHRWLMDNTRDWAVLRPSWFMQNFSEGQHLATIRADDAIYSATESGRVPFISVDDIALVACAALTAATALNDDFILTGREAISYDGVAGLISAACGRRITHRRIGVDALAQRLRARGLPDKAATQLASMDEAIAGGSEDRTTDAVARLTGRAPMTFDTFASANAAIWQTEVLAAVAAPAIMH